MIVAEMLDLSNFRAFLTCSTSSTNLDVSYKPGSVGWSL